MSLVFPSSPSTGQTFPAPLVPGQPSWVWDGAKWTSRGLANAMVATSPLPPLNPRVGDLWFDPVEGNTYVYFDDGNSQQWVVAINQTTSFANLPYFSANLSNNLNFGGTFIDGPSVNVGNLGTWFVSAAASVFYTDTPRGCIARIWDGTTIIVDSVANTPAANWATTLSLSGIINNPTGPIKLSCVDSSSTSSNTGYMCGNLFWQVISTTTKQTHITAIRIG